MMHGKHMMPEKHKAMKGKKMISRKVAKLRREGYAQDQAVAIAHDMARKRKKKGR